MTFINERKRLTVEELATDCIDVRELNRKGLLRERTVTFRPLLRWPDVTTMRADRYLIEVNLRYPLTQYIRLSWTPCHFGGSRPWMLCPCCQKRIARVFMGLGGYFCRACVGNPPYESQLRNNKARAYLKAYRLRQQLGGSRPVVHPIPERPYRMWRKTYERIRAEIERLERTLIGSRVVKRPPLWIRPLFY
jgi:hypothetical protein